VTGLDNLKAASALIAASDYQRPSEPECINPDCAVGEVAVILGRDQDSGEYDVEYNPCPVCADGNYCHTCGDMGTINHRPCIDCSGSD
jgi:hypothetical protein